MDAERPVDQYVQVRDIRTRYWSMGVGNSYVLLLHGLGGHLENWEPNIAALAWGRQVFALDLVGFGRTDKPPGRHSIPFLVDFRHIEPRRHAAVLHAERQSRGHGRLAGSGLYVIVVRAIKQDGAMEVKTLKQVIINRFSADNTLVN